MLKVAQHSWELWALWPILLLDFEYISPKLIYLGGEGGGAYALLIGKN